MASASSKQVVPAFSHPFVQVDDDNRGNMLEKEIKQVADIHKLLTAAVIGGDDLDSVDRSMEDLEKKLMAKNMVALTAVCIIQGMRLFTF
jgi:hypothetical protein